ECQGQQGVAGQDRQRLAELLVTGRQATAKVVVVHGGQVVVDQRIRVNHFDRGRGGQGVTFVAACGLVGHQHQERPQTFSGGQQTVAHRLGERRGATLAKGNLS